jgi:hypothetical protein
MGRVISDSLIDLLGSVFSKLPTLSNGHPFFAPGHVSNSSRPRTMPDDPLNLQISPTPSDPTNELLAGYMAHASLRFVADHEFFHAFHGHLLLIEELRERQRFPPPNRSVLNYDRDI